MTTRQQYRPSSFKPTAKVAPTIAPKLHLYTVTLVDGRVFTSMTPTTRKGAYELATAGYGNERPLAASIVANDPTLRSDKVPVWFVERLLKAKVAAAAKDEADRILSDEVDRILAAEAEDTARRMLAEANAAAAARARRIPPCPRPRNLFTLDYGTGPALGSDPSLDEAERIMTTEALMGATVEFDWTESGFGFGTYRSGFHLAR